jgi:hypothetical protein
VRVPDLERKSRGPDGFSNAGFCIRV